MFGICKVSIFWEATVVETVHKTINF